MKIPKLLLLMVGASVGVFHMASAVEPVLFFDFNDPEYVASQGSEPLELMLRNIRISPGGVTKAEERFFLNNSNVAQAGGPGGYAVSESPLVLGDIASFTISGWLRHVRSAGQVDAARILLWKSTNGGIDLRLYTNKVHLATGGYGAEAPLIRFDEFTIPEDSPEWIFFAVTWSLQSGGETSLWIGQSSTGNLTRVSRKKGSAVLLAPANTSLLVAAGTGGSRALAGQMDNLRFYASAKNDFASLPETQLRALFNEGRR